MPRFSLGLEDSLFALGQFAQAVKGPHGHLRSSITAGGHPPPRSWCQVYRSAKAFDPHIPLHIVIAQIDVENRRVGARSDEVGQDGSVVVYDEIDDALKARHIWEIRLSFAMLAGPGVVLPATRWQEFRAHDDTINETNELGEQHTIAGLIQHQAIQIVEMSSVHLAATSRISRAVHSLP